MKKKRQKGKDKREQKRLMKSSDEEVLKALPADEDNSRINIKKVVANMDDPENKAKVVGKNLDEIIEQNDVRDTLVHLEDESIVEIVQDNIETLVENRKIVPAIRAIDDPKAQVGIVQENINKMTAGETAAVLNSLETKEEPKFIEIQKIKLASQKMLERMVKYGHVSQLDIQRLTDSLESEHSKLDIIKLCLSTVDSYEKNKKKNITSDTKVKFVYDMFKFTEIEDHEKDESLQQFVEEGILGKEERQKIANKLQIDREKEEKDQGRDI